MRPAGACAVFVLLAATAPGRAGQDCNKAIVQSDINLCMQHNYEDADAELNRVWKALPQEARDRLREDERHWITSRDIACKRAAAESEGGSIYPTEFYGCLEERTRKRIKELRAQMP